MPSETSKPKDRVPNDIQNLQPAPGSASLAEPEAGQASGVPQGPEARLKPEREPAETRKMPARCLRILR
jgi:hypothetical protein